MYGILAFGDSITQGRGVISSKGWADKLKNDFESRDFFNVFYNLGIPGDSSADLLKRFETELKARVNYYHSDNKFLILIAIGTNDSRSIGSSDNIQTRPQEYDNNIRKLLSIAKEQTKNVVLIGLPPVDESLMPFENTYFNNAVIQEFNEILKEIAKNNDLLFCEVFEGFIKQGSYKSLFVDGVHPNEKGYELMYNLIKNFLIKKRLL